MLIFRSMSKNNIKKANVILEKLQSSPKYVKTGWNGNQMKESVMGKKIKNITIESQLEYLKKHLKDTDTLLEFAIREKKWNDAQLEDAIIKEGGEIAMYFDIRSKILTQIIKGLNPDLQSRYGFNLTPNKQKHLIDIYNSLVENHFISKEDVSLMEFKRLFNNNLISNIKTVNWLKSISTLKYLIKLFDIKLEPKERDIKIITLFTHKGKELTIDKLDNNKHSVTKYTKILESIFKSYPSN